MKTTENFNKDWFLMFKLDLENQINAVNQKLNESRKKKKELLFALRTVKEYIKQN